jgi:hypothetical protein
MAQKEKQAKRPAEQPDPFATLYPNIAAWVQNGWVEIGRDEDSPSFVRALDTGGLVWEGKARYPTLHAALKDLDAGFAAWLEETG